VSFKRWTRELLAVLMAFCVLSESSPRDAMESILRRTTYILIPVSLLLIKYFPEYGIEYSSDGTRLWIGLAMQKNGLGRLCLIGSFFLIWSLVTRFRENKPSFWDYQTYTECFLLFMAFWLLGGPGRSPFYSATSFYTLCLGLLVFSGLSLAKKRGKMPGSAGIIIVISIIMIYGVAILFTGPSNVAGIASAANRNDTLTGRTLIWGVLLPMAMQRPILGHGFGSFWITLKTTSLDILSSHNGYLDVLLGLGFLGIFLTAAFLLSFGRKAYRILFYDFNWGVLSICFLIMFVVHNITESSIDSFTLHQSAIIIFLSVTSMAYAFPKNDTSEAL
jgi:O-antigen ligase